MAALGLEQCLAVELGSLAIVLGSSRFNRSSSAENFCARIDHYRPIGKAALPSIPPWTGEEITICYGPDCENRLGKAEQRGSERQFCYNEEIRLLLMRRLRLSVEEPRITCRNSSLVPAAVEAKHPGLRRYASVGLSGIRLA